MAAILVVHHAKIAGQLVVVRKQRRPRRSALGQARRRGRTSVALMVDSESPTGATRLYESVGMTVDKVLVSWKGEVRPP